MAGDMIVKIDDVSTAGMALDDAAKRIRGPEGTTVKLTIFRRLEEGEAEYKEFTVKRESIPLESIKESRIVRDGIGYIRISDFKDNTAKDLARNIEQLLGNGMTSLILDLRWNPGGLLSASKEACELFLPKNTLVTYTKGRNSTTDKKSSEDLRLYTERSPVLPENFPLVVLVNEQTASSAEIVTGALQFWAKAIIVGQTTYGKGSVQTIIPLSRPPGSALRLTTALYYTPAEVTIDSAGIKPDVEAPLSRKQQVALLRQMYESIRDDASRLNSQNHGAVTGEKPTEGSVEDVQLKRAVEILEEDPVFEKLLTKYHKDTHETRVAASPDKVLQQGRVADERDIELDEPLEEEPAPEDKPSNEPVPAEP